VNTALSGPTVVTFGVNHTKTDVSTEDRKVTWLTSQRISTPLFAHAVAVDGSSNTDHDKVPSSMNKLRTSSPSSPRVSTLGRMTNSTQTSCPVNTPGCVG